MKLKLTLYAIAFLALSTNIQTLANTRHYSRTSSGDAPSTVLTADADTLSGHAGQNSGTKKKGFLNRLAIGGYGEAVYSYNMYSDNVYRYTFADRYRDARGYGRFDLPHVVIMIGYDFGRGWSLGTEIEFEHGGVEAAVEMEDEEAGEFEKEIERGGEVALEQFWIQKSFFPQLNLKAGHIIVPVGLTNSYHLPTQFFTVYRPEGENTIFPCTWHETGISLWGRAGDWRYEAMLIPGLNSMLFNVSGWVHDGSASPYEFRPGNKLAGAFRVDNWSVKGLRMGLSGYVGNSFANDIVTENSTYTRYAGVKGTVVIGAFDFEYNDHGLVARGSVDYGHLSDADMISYRNRNADHTDASPYSRMDVAPAAMAAGVEVGYDFFSLNPELDRQKFYLFGRFEYYDSFIAEAGANDYAWAEKNRIAVGINYFPIPEIVIKAEYSHRLLQSMYNDEPSVSIGIAYSGFFKH